MSTTLNSGIDPASFSAVTGPSQDLFRFVNGPWVDMYRLPDDRSRYGSFAKLAEDATSADKMRGLVNLVLQAIGTMSVLACRTCGTNTVVLTGALTMLPPAHETFELFTQLYGVEYIIPENATFATAIGAGLYSLQKKPEA